MDPQADPLADPLSPADTDDRFDRLVALWVETLAPLAGIRPRAPKRSSAIGQALAARIDEHGFDDVASVLRWFATSDSQRARFLRDGGYGLSTLLRPTKFTDYADMANRPEPAAPGEWRGQAAAPVLFDTDDAPREF
jgi:hypothetical protein